MKRKRAVSIIAACAVMALLAGTGATVYSHITRARRIERAQIAAQAAFNKQAAPVLKAFARQTDIALSYSLKTYQYRFRKNDYQRILDEIPSLEASARALNPPNEEMLRLKSYLLELTGDLKDYVEAQIKILDMEIFSIAFREKIAAYETAANRFYDDPLIRDEARYRRLQDRVRQARGKLTNFNEDTDRFRKDTAREAALRLYRKAAPFLETYRDMFISRSVVIWMHMQMTGVRR